MPAIFKQPSTVSCFYCQSAVTPIPRNPRSFRCPHCDCWNRYDAKGEIVSDEPAMHDENLNALSFARRASPRKDRLPSMYGSSFFCHTCQTNQVLRNNLLSNYLPPPTDPEYERRLEELPEYQRSIEVRYPPICANCLPTVEAEIRKRDQEARIRALGGALKNTKGTDSRRRSSVTQKQKERLEVELRIWRIRGFLWVGSVAFATAAYGSIAASYHLVSLPSFFPLAMPIVVVASIFWTAWDPTYMTVRRYQFQGRTVRVYGKKQHSIFLLVAWFLRLTTSALLLVPRYRPDWELVHLWDEPRSSPARIYTGAMLVVEIIIVFSSLFVLRVQHPPPVRLVDSKSHLRQLSTTPSLPSSRDVTPVAAEPDLLATLTLSNNPIIGVTSAQNPIFGMPSLSTAASPPRSTTPRPPGMDVDMDDDEGRDPDAMDIDTASPQKKPSLEDDGSWLRPQRFFAPEEPTGLENLFARTIRLVDPSEQNENGTAQGSLSRRQGTRRTGRSSMRSWRIWLAVCVVPVLVAAGYMAWGVRRQKTVLVETVDM
ncbi:Ima1 N-terminal domain-containing protein [Daedaleopsis nitida]|nr:Ima1 N-terminal domain-containing protein [Daedaleopsis nitida]